MAKSCNPGTLNHAIVRGIEGAEIVRGVKDRKEFIKRMGMPAGARNTRIYAWTLMAKHAQI